LKESTRKLYIIGFALIMSIILYFSGVFSGLNANKIIKESTQKDIFDLRKETSEDLNSLQSYISFLDNNLKGMQLEQTFTESLNQDEMCSFSAISLSGLFSQLPYYWERLPYRIEEFEKYNQLSEEYNTLKQQYTHVSIRTWILARNQKEKCNIDLIHGLYFYSADCKDCVKQGEQLDVVNKELEKLGIDIVMFPIDYNSNEQIISNLKKYYKIKSTPAIIINDNILQGRLFEADEILAFSEK
jgi:thiol-disulfide isomerase/thioredoxin